MNAAVMGKRKLDYCNYVWGGGAKNSRASSEAPGIDQNESFTSQHFGPGGA